MKSSEIFSIVVPTLNEEEHIEYLLRSVHAQDYRPIEVVVVDDGSTDKTVEIVVKMIQELNNEFFQIVLLEERSFGEKLRGPAFARNLGIRHSTGEYILLIDADMALIDRRIISDLAGALKSTNVAGFKAIVLVDNWIEYNLMMDGGAPPYASKVEWQCLAFKREILNRFIFDVSLGVGEDVDLLKTLNEHGLLNPKIIQRVGALHLPHSLEEYRLQKIWHGRTVWLWIKKHHSIKSILKFSPVAPFISLTLAVIGLLLALPWGYIFLAFFLGIFFTLFLRSPSKDFRRIAYLLAVRLVYGSFFFIYGIIDGLYQLCRGKRINPSRSK